MQAHPVRRSRGVIMVIALITLAVLMIGAVAAIRSMNVSLANVGNFGFKRDMTNQADRAMRKAMGTINAGGLFTATDASINYSAAMLTTTPEGIPQVLTTMPDPGTMGGVASARNVIDLNSAVSGESTTDLARLTVYYVIDRMCVNPGPMDAAGCATASVPIQGGKSVNDVVANPKPLYRISVRVDGPRGAQSFYQATVSN
ncbi:hypothetical protein [Roseateles chitinivorans]|uniref:hypothetical protein n=1 Tax=Roseateles chitinivorans TaxID=2917965 RepID=UPI003D675706